MKLTLTPWSGKPSYIRYEGINFEIQPYTKVQTQYIAKLNTLKASVDWQGLSESERASYSGQAMAGTIVTNFDSFKIPESGMVVSFDGQSDDSRFESLAEQLLAEDEMLQAEIFEHSFQRSNFRDLQEREALGES